MREDHLNWQREVVGQTIDWMRTKKEEKKNKNCWQFYSGHAFLCSSGRVFEQTTWDYRDVCVWVCFCALKVFIFIFYFVQNLFYMWILKSWIHNEIEFEIEICRNLAVSRLDCCVLIFDEIRDKFKTRTHMWQMWIMKSDEIQSENKVETNASKSTTKWKKRKIVKIEIGWMTDNSTEKLHKRMREYFRQWQSTSNLFNRSIVLFIANLFIGINTHTNTHENQSILKSCSILKIGSTTGLCNQQSTIFSSSFFSFSAHCSMWWKQWPVMNDIFIRVIIIDINIIWHLTKLSTRHILSCPLTLLSFSFVSFPFSVVAISRIEITLHFRSEILNKSHRTTCDQIISVFSPWRRPMCWNVNSIEKHSWNCLCVSTLSSTQKK